MRSLNQCDVYILTGQSNALGTTASDDDMPLPAVDLSDEAPRLCWANVDAANTQYPPALYGHSAGQFRPLGVQQGRGADPVFWGPEISFLQELDKMTSATQTMIVKACRGGGSNRLWDRQTFQIDSHAGHMWGHLCRTVDTALQTLQNQGTNFFVRGLLYLQGESNTPEDAAIADTRLLELSQNLQSHLAQHHPDSIDQFRLMVGEIAASQSNTARQLTTEKHRLLAGRDASTVFVPTRDLPLKADGLHFGGRAKLEIGRRFAHAYVS